MNDRAVSNVLGYVLLFAVVLSSIIVVGTVGVDQLTDARDGTTALNAEFTMTGVASAVDDVHRENVSRTSRVGLGGGSLEAGEQTTIKVDIGDDGSFELSDQTQSIVYRTGNTQIVYVAGAVFRMEEEGEVVVREPDYRVESDSAIIPIPLTEAESPGSAVSGSNAQIRLARAGSMDLKTGSNDVGIKFVTPNNDQALLWYSVLKERHGFNCDGGPPTGDTVDCSHSASDVLVRMTTTRFAVST